MQKKLTPLTPEQAEEFERRRISATVVQNKCPSCGAWYETARRDVEFTEAFLCDCGQRMEFKVPPLEIIRPATNMEKIALSGDQRLDTGMKVTEAMKRAEAWWAKTGSKQMRQHHMRQRESLTGAFASLDPDNPSFLPSGIIHGKEWDALTKREKLMIIKTWHHFYVRRPDLLGEDSDTELKIHDMKEVK